MNENIIKIDRRAESLGLDRKSYILKLQDPVFFATEVWHDRGLNRYGELREYEQRMIRWSCEGPPKRGCLAPRGLGKTYFGALILASWSLFCNAEEKILFTSKSEKHARQSIHHLKDWFRTIPFLTHMYAGNVHGKRWHITEMDVLNAEGSRTPSITAVGIEGQLPGTRASKVIADDIETDGTARTADGRDNIERKTREFASIATYGNREIVFFGTHFFDDSIYCKLNRIEMTTGPNAGEKVYHFRTWPIVAPTESESEKMLGLDPKIRSEMKLGSIKAGNKLFPHRHSDIFIAQQRAHGLTHWNRQYMLIPSIPDELRFPLKLKDFIVFDGGIEKAPISISWGVHNSDGKTTSIQDIVIGPSEGILRAPIFFDSQWAPYQRTIMWIDTAGSGVDQTAYCIASQLNGYIWVHEVFGFEPGSGFTSSTLATIASRAKHFRVREIFVEKNFGHGMFAPLLMPWLERGFERIDDKGVGGSHGWSCSITGAQAIGRKEIRICDSLEGPMQSHRIILSRQAASNQALQEQVHNASRRRGTLDHDDQVESLAMAVYQFREDLGVDPEQQAERFRNTIRDREMEFEIEELFGEEEEVESSRWFSHCF